MEAGIDVVGSGPLKEYIAELCLAVGKDGETVLLRFATEGNAPARQPYLVVDDEPEDRRRRIRESDAAGSIPAVALIHPRAHVGADVEIGGGSIVLAGAQITTHVRIGAHCVIGVNAIVSHDCSLGAGVVLSPGAILNGSVSVGNFALIGSGAVVIPGIRIGTGAVVDAGSVVIRDVKDETHVGGTPARPLDEQSAE